MAKKTAFVIKVYNLAEDILQRYCRGIVEHISMYSFSINSFLRLLAESGFKNVEVLEHGSSLEYIAEK